jgi:Transposase IS116/IS110/IS902 family
MLDFFALRCSGGKRRAGPNRHGSMWLRVALTEAAQAAARTKGTYLAAHRYPHRLLPHCPGSGCLP